MLAPTLRRAALIALALLMVPLIASRLTPGWNWPPQAFLLTYVLFFLTTLAFLRISRHSQLTTYKLAVGLSLLTGFALGWSNMVHISESENPLNFLYFTVLLTGMLGAWLTRLQPLGLARTLFAMSALMAVLSFFLSTAAPAGFETRVNTGHILTVLLFATAGLLFQSAYSNSSMQR